MDGTHWLSSKLSELNFGPPPFHLKWDSGNWYIRVLFRVYCASYCCGVGLIHLTPNDDVYPTTTSIMRFHLYFNVRRLFRRMEGGESMRSIARQFGGHFYDDVGKVPWRFDFVPFTKDSVNGVHNIKKVQPDWWTHYMRYVPRTSDGLTKIGLQYLNQSVEAYIYVVLGSQAKTRVSIVDHGGGSLEIQQECRKQVEDAVTNYSVSTWILNMKKPITDTNTIQDLDLSPKTWLVPSKMVILKNPMRTTTIC